MDLKDYKRLNSFKHWWFEAKRRLILSQIKKDSSLLEVGCGVSDLFNKELNIVGIDLDQESVNLNKKRGMNSLVGTALALPFDDCVFDVVILADILEHIKESEEALLESKRVLKEDGKLIITLPANKYLWSSHDVELGHVKRYSKKEVIQLASDAGLKTMICSYWNTFLFVPIFLLLNLSKLCKFKINAVKKNNTFLNNLFLYVLNFETWLLNKGVRFPFGVSVFGVFKK